MTGASSLPPPSTDASVEDGFNQLLPVGYLNVLGLLIRNTGQTVDELIDWYENIHSRNASAVWPFMNRYGRNFIRTVEEGAQPPYLVLTEFDWKSEEDKVRARAAFQEPDTVAAMASEYAGTPPAWLQDIYSILVPVTRHQIAGTLPALRPGGQVERRAMLLRREEGVSEQQFASAALSLAQEAAREMPGAAVILDLCHGPRASQDEPDAVLFIEGAGDQALPRPDPRWAKVSNIFTVESRQSPI